MNIIQSPKIGLCIAGTKSRQGGFAPLMIAGILAGNEDNNMDRVTLVAEKTVYIIKHTNEYILYLLVDRKVKPCDRDTPGVLSIALTIARDMQLANDKSPYSLLKEVYEKFRNDYMTPCSDGRDSFINKDVEQADFMSIMDQYPLEKRSSVYIPMNPSGISGTLRVPQEQMVDLFRDSQYKEFAGYKEIEIGTESNCQTMPDLKDIEIPRPVTYSIVVNGRTVKATLTKPTDSFDTASLLSDTQDVKYSHISFSLKDLLDSPEYQIMSGKSFAVLDKERSRIVCKVHKEQITYTLEYCIEGGTDKDQQKIANEIASGQIKLVVGNNQVQFYSSSPQKAEILASWVQQKVIVTPNYKDALRLNVSKIRFDEENRNVVVIIQLTSEIADSPNNLFNNRRSSLNFPAKSVKEREVVNNYEEKVVRRSDTNDKLSSKKTNKRWIFLAISCFLSMCIGAGIMWLIKGKSSQILTYDDSLQIAKSIPVDSALIYKIINSQKENETVNNIDNIDSDTPSEVALVSNHTEKEGETEKLTEETGEIVNQVKKDSLKSFTKAQVREQILQLINQKKLDECRKHKGWNKHYLTNQELCAAEAVLDLNSKQYAKLTPQAKKNIKELNKGTFKTFNEVIQAQQEIWRIMGNDYNVKKNNTK